MGKRVVCTSSFKKRAFEVHGDTYDYSLSEYESTITPLIIICRIHGEFTQKPSNHLSGNGCPRCGIQKNGASLKLSQEEIIQRIVEKSFKGRTLKEVVLTDGGNSFSAVCPKHGKFSRTTRGVYLKEAIKFLCRKCGLESRSEKRKLKTPVSFGEYPPVNFERDYVNSHSKIERTCTKHGNFSSYYLDIVTKSVGCSKCVSHVSKSEVDLTNFIKSLGIELISNKTIPNSGRNLRPDILIPSIKLVIEYNGTWAHSTLKKDKGYHKSKRMFYESLGYRSVMIWETDWHENRSATLSYLKNILVGAKERIFARKCVVETVSQEQANTFYQKNHLLGRTCNCEYNIALKSGDRVVCMASFNKSYQGHWELKRMANLIDCRVVGGFSRLLSYWRKNNPYEYLYSYVDRDKFTGESYIKLGFKKYSESVMLFGVQNKKRIDRHQMKKTRILSKYPHLPSDIKESELCKKLNIFRCYTSGTDSLFLPPLIEIL